MENGEKKYCSPWVRPASTTEAGVVIVDGSTITINNGVISASGTSYTLPTASTTTKGGVKVDGSTIKIADEVISADFSGLQTEITSTNKLSADLLKDGTANKVVTATEKSTWNGKQDTISDLSTIRTNASSGASAATTIAGYGDIVTHDASEFQEAGDYADAVHTHVKADITDFPTIPTVNNATISIQKNGTLVDSFTANQSTAKTINITVPTTAADVSALPSSTKYAASIDLSINTTTYVVTAQLKDQDGNNLGTADTIDLPLETMVVSGSYDSVNQKVILTLKNGETVEFSVADLVSGLQTEITSTNKLSADLIKDGTTNKTVTATEKSTWNGKQNTISDLTTIRSNATAGANAATTISGYGDIVTHDADEFAEADHTHSQYLTGITSSDVTTALGFTPYSNTNPNGYTSNQGTVTKVNNTLPDANGNVTLSIPSAVTESTVSGWGFTKNAGTITGITMNGSSKGTSGVIDLGTVLTEHQSLAGLQTEITSTNKLSADLISDGTTNKTVTSTEKSTWNGKQDAISDLATIRTGAGLGATALQPNTAITGNTKCKITYDANGLVTGGADLTASDLPSHTHTVAQITDIEAAFTALATQLENAINA